MRKLVCWCLLGVVLFGVGVTAADRIRVVPLVRDQHVLITFEFSDGFTDDVRAVIASGLTLTFQYEVELRLDVPIWVDRTIDSATITASVKYDNLTRRYHLTRELNGRIEEARVTEDPQVLRRWLTSFERMALFETTQLERNREYYLRVRAGARPGNTWSIWPWGAGATGLVKFTFVP